MSTSWFYLPKTKVWKTRKIFQPNLVQDHPMAHYCTEKSFVLCHTCTTQHKQRNMKLSTKLEMTFIETGFTNWKKAIEKFKDHEDSSCHREAINVSEIAERNANLPEMFDSKLTYEKFDNRQAFLEILESI